MDEAKVQIERGLGTFYGQAASRDKELVTFVGKQGIVSYGHVMEEFEIGRTAAYRLVKASVERGLISRDDSLRNEPSVLYATREGLRWAELAYPVASLSPSLIHHGLTCTTVALALREQYAGRVHTERQLAWLESYFGKPVASAKVGVRADGGPRLHRPDLSAKTPDGRTVAVEVELTPKAPKRLEWIMRAWRRSPWVLEVVYYCAAGETLRAVQRAIIATHSENVSLEEVVSV